MMDVELDWSTNTLSLRVDDQLFPLGSDRDIELLVARLVNGAQARKSAPAAVERVAERFKAAGWR